MKLKSILIIFVFLISLAQLSIIAISLFSVNYFEKESQTRMAEKEIAHFYNFYQEEIIGYLIAKNYISLQSFLENVSISNNLKTSLQYGDRFNFSNLPKSMSEGALKVYDLSFAGKDYGKITFYRPTKLHLVGHHETYYIILGFQIILSFILVNTLYFYTKASFLRPLLGLKKISSNGEIKEDRQVIESKFVPQEVKEIESDVVKVWNKYRKESEASTKAKIYEDLAHDIKPPVDSLKNIFQALKNDIDDENIVKLSEDAIEHIKEMAATISNNAKPGKSIRTVPKVHIKNELEKIVLSKRLGIKNSGAETKIDLKFSNISCKAYIEMPTLEFRRIFENIINNAIESEANSINIDIECFDKDTKVTISDNGKGIPQENIEKVFKRGFTSGKDEGTGLGLSNTKKLIENHDGSISFDSNLNEGTKFTVTLPISNPFCMVGTKNLEDVEYVFIDDSKAQRNKWEFISKEKDIKAIILGDEQELYKILQSFKKSTRFFVDCNLNGDKGAGERIINKLESSKFNNSIVLTGYEKDLNGTFPKFMQRIEKRGITILSKSNYSQVEKVLFS